MEAIDDYVALQKQVLSSVIPLLDSTDLSALEKFDLYMQIAQTQGASLELLQKAYQVAQSIEGQDKVGALVDLLSEIGVAIQGNTRTPVNENTENSQTNPEDSEQQSPEQSDQQ